MTLAFVFPGQGSQSVGMLAELANVEPLVRAIFDEASMSLDRDLWSLVVNGPEQDLNQTRNTQPVMLTAGVAVWRVWRDKNGMKPSQMAGHSLGEYTALVCAGALDFANAVKLVDERAKLMQNAVPEGQGAMAAILGLDDESVRSACATAADGEVVEAVNYNAPGQVVIAGSKAAVSRAIEVAKDAGAKRAMPLPVSVPSHCALMKSAAEKLKSTLEDIEIATPEVPVIHNVDVTSHSDPGSIREALVKQLHNPVRWVDTIRAMAAEGMDALVECGPGKVLAGLNRRIERRMPVHAMFDPDTVAKALDLYTA